MNVFCIHSPTLCLSCWMVGAILIMFTFYIKLFTFVIQPRYHGAGVATLRQDSVCSFYLFVIAFFVTLGVIPPCEKSWEQKNKKITKKELKKTPFLFQEVSPKETLNYLLNHESSSLTLFHFQLFPLRRQAAAYLYNFVLLIVMLGLCVISPGSRICSQL